jgi:hypothetical protein
MSPIPRRFVLLASLLLVSLSPAQAEVIKDNAGWYSVDMPLPTTHGDEFQDSDFGKLRIYNLSHESAKTLYTVLYMDFPDGIFAGRDTSALYDAEIAEQVRSAHGTLRSSVPCQLGDFTGREAIIDDPVDHNVIRMRCFIVGDRLMEIMFGGEKGMENSPAALKFLDSFRLLHTPKSHPAR